MPKLQELPPVLKVQVYDLDITMGTPGNMGLCMVAKAMFRATDKPCAAGYHFIYIDTGSENEVRVKTPVDVARRMRLYDSKRIAEPFAFELEMAKGRREGISADE